LVVVQRGFRVESNPVICGLLDRDVDTFVVLNFGNKSCALSAFIDLLSKFLFLLILS
jgi:hypothetical protein